MSLRLEMLQVARLAPKMLGESSPLVADFVRRQQHASGGFTDRHGRPDLYYTVFALDALLALREAPEQPGVENYLGSFGDGRDLDIVHRCCLVRAWASLKAIHPATQTPAWFRDFAPSLEQFRALDGGYNVEPGAAAGSAYAAFLAVGAIQDSGSALNSLASVPTSLEALRTPDGAWSNERGMALGATNSTAAAIGALRQLGVRFNPDAPSKWLLSQAHPMGGFRAIPNAPIPDLLSTATALHALAAMETPLDSIRESCLDFVDTLWSNEGGFHGHWHEDHLDCEYTYYGLLALGHLAS